MPSRAVGHTGTMDGPPVRSVDSWWFGSLTGGIAGGAVLVLLVLQSENPRRASLVVVAIVGLLVGAAIGLALARSRAA